MRRFIERLEERNLLAGDVQLVYGSPSAPDETGIVTRQIQVFSDVAGDVLIESSLTDDFENPTWELTRGYSNRNMDLGFLPETPDFQIRGPGRVQDVGDLNGDGRNDFLVDGNQRALVFYGCLLYTSPSPRDS